MKVLLCGHTGSTNHGCEAIVRSTTHILSQLGVECVCATMDMNADWKAGLKDVVKLIPYPAKNAVIRGVSLLRKQVFHDQLWGNAYFYRKLLDDVKPDVVFNVGGDTYCYGIPWISIALNVEAERRGIPTVFWGCSVEEDLPKQSVLREDINRYARIVSRESLSRSILAEVYAQQAHLFQCCDPAFQLPMTETDLPEGFMEGNTVGINLSPVMMGGGAAKDSMVFKNVKNLVEHIFATSGLNVCLIPHVYKAEPVSGDRTVLDALYQEFSDSGRVSIVKEEHSCTELKYIISKCRFFIGARTHSMIAAYSNHVPAIGLSYSMKSRGLARDIMGTEDGYAVSWKAFTDENQLTKLYEEKLVRQEQEIRERYQSLMPEYKASILSVTKHILAEL